MAEKKESGSETETGPIPADRGREITAGKDSRPQEDAPGVQLPRRPAKDRQKSMTSERSIHHGKSAGDVAVQIADGRT